MICTRTRAHTDTVRANLDQWASTAPWHRTCRFTDAELVHKVEILEATVGSAETWEIVTVARLGR